ncbi:pseudouridine synthase [Veillonella rodentium]|uniref:Pseudouridine synthase n=1 Tax=Veillonella rodentium TaxID=248315 RepID=A0A239Z2I7_9FIRM|nr:pseudouridine synthase [Veillonella rodentium]SNV64836.1 Ribosomal small subunit pseudouridine synthase A [Veillonella rodentium]
MRLDKLLANKAYGSRKEVHQIIKDKRVSVNGIVATKKDMHIDLDSDNITVDGQPVNSTQAYYIKFHKPKGYVTAVEDPMHPVVMDLLPPEFRKMGVVPVGRLDKDTEGLLLLTNDGIWGHSIINGHKHIPKVYYVEYDGTLSADGLQRIREGIVLGDGTICKPAELEILSQNTLHITIEEGKYHQAKRMIGAAGGTVTYLKRLSIGSVDLNGIETVGSMLELTPSEVDAFKK